MLGVLVCSHSYALSDMQKIKEAVKADALSADNPEAKKDAVRVVRSDFMKRCAPAVAVCRSLRTCCGQAALPSVCSCALSWTGCALCHRQRQSARPCASLQGARRWLCRTAPCSPMRLASVSSRYADGKNAWFFTKLRY